VGLIYGKQPSQTEGLTVKTYHVARKEQLNTNPQTWPQSLGLAFLSDKREGLNELISDVLFRHIGPVFCFCFF
jgi:hypothetical protein